MVETGASTVVGPSILINGNLQGDEDLTVLGRVEGSISLTKTLHVEESGIVKADISVRNAVVSGVVVGNITATDSVEITEAGRMVGDIRAPRVIIVDGARFRGAVDMGDLEAPRPSSPLPERKTTSLTRTARPTMALPTRRNPPPPPARAAAPTRPAAPAARPVVASRKEGADGERAVAPAVRQAPVMASKKLKKKVVVKKKAEEV